MLLVGMLAGITLGGVFVTWLGKRHKDANIRAAAILFGCTTMHGHRGAADADGRAGDWAAWRSG